MTNLASVLEVADFTPEELEIVKAHIENYSAISFDNMTEAWRDEEGNLCISYEIGQWWNYNGTKKAWW